MELDFSLPAARVIQTLKQVIEWCGKPLYIRCDNGPEVVSNQLKRMGAIGGDYFIVHPTG